MSQPRMLLPPVSGPADFARAFDVSRETLARLEVYAALLAQWQKAVNLVAPRTLEEVWHRHFADSAQLLALAPATALRWVDLGSGGGFPGLVLAVMLADRPGARMTLVESDQRKGAFLRECARQMAIPVDILSGRIEDPATHSRLGVVDVVTARALAPLDRLLALAAPLIGPATVALFLKGRELRAEIEAARRAWRLDVEPVASRTDGEGRIAVIRGVTPRQQGPKDGGELP